jgi:AraC-like DNA-binding protein
VRFLLILFVKHDKIRKKQGGIGMNKTDIVRENLCIKRIILVVRGYIPHTQRYINVKDRHSDAFVYITEGSCVYHFDDGVEFLAGEGDVFYLPNHAVYRMQLQSENYRSIFCDFEFAEPGAKVAAIWHRQNQGKADTLFSKLLNRFTSPEKNTYTECMSILYNIYNLLQQSRESSYLNKNRKDDISNIKRYMDEHFNLSDLSITSLSEKSGISEVYLRKLFSAHYNTSPRQYVLNLRIQKAKQLLTDTPLRMTTIAAQCGFSSQYHFCRIFKERTGLTPTQYAVENRVYNL